MSWLGSIGSRVFPAVNRKPAQPRLRRAASGCRVSVPLPGSALFRARRGFLMLLPLAWRRCALGTNHIASHGVWRIGTRRTARRLNARGETRWYLSRRLTPSLAPSFSLPGQPQQGVRA